MILPFITTMREFELVRFALRFSTLPFRSKNKPWETTVEVLRVASWSSTSVLRLPSESVAVSRAVRNWAAVAVSEASPRSDAR